MPFSDFKVIGIVGRRDFKGAGSKSHVNIGISDHGYFPVQKGEYDGNCFQILVAGIILINL